MFTARPFVSPEAQRLLELLKTLFGSTFRQILWRNAAELELTYAQAQVLFYVAQHPDCHMGQVAKRSTSRCQPSLRSWTAWCRSGF
jgi:hypothetical protein